MRFPLLMLCVAAALAGCDSSERSSDRDTAPAATAGAALDNIAVEPPSASGAAPESGENALMQGNDMADFSPDDWLGRWKGVEGTYLVVSKGSSAGHYRLEMQYTLDDKGVFDGIVAGDGISFTRPGGAYVLRASDGEATGLKYLASKTDCLKVKDGEGYCRD